MLDELTSIKVCPLHGFNLIYELDKKYIDDLNNNGFFDFLSLFKDNAIKLTSLP